MCVAPLMSLRKATLVCFVMAPIPEPCARVHRDGEPTVWPSSRREEDTPFSKEPFGRRLLRETSLPQGLLSPGPCRLLPSVLCTTGRVTGKHGFFSVQQSRMGFLRCCHRSRKIRQLSEVIHLFLYGLDTYERKLKACGCFYQHS